MDRGELKMQERAEVSSRREAAFFDAITNLGNPPAFFQYSEHKCSCQSDVGADRGDDFATLLFLLETVVFRR